MRRTLLLLLLVTLFAIHASAQEYSRVQVFGGYSYTNYPVFQIYSGPWSRASFNGWDASAAFKLTPNFSIEGDFGGGFNSANSRTNRLVTFMGGPRVSTNYGKIAVYGHVLVGGLNFHGNSGSATSFAAAFGGGADYWLGRRVGVKIAQFDVLVNTNSAAFGGGNGASQPRADFRIATGVIFRFGK
ncbi:MAG TPA: hypothetical protein VE377_19525 [Candidatus Dormibacteraeota bacterium]|nr:hypothetical protein [Candidatus Dormibacteraeota bacterium]